MADSIVYALRTDGCEPVWAGTGEDTRGVLAEGDISLVVLNVGLQDCNDFDLCREIRRTRDVPVIFLTARSEEMDRVIGLELAAEVGVVPPRCGDELLLRQALFKLVHNALAATPAGGRVTVRARAAADAVEFSVLDTGPGVPAFALPRVFDKFYSLTPAANGSPGTGLGLPFVREVALLHGGEATLANRPDGWAGAAIRLPLRPSRRRYRSEAQAAPPVSGGRCDSRRPMISLMAGRAAWKQSTSAGSNAAPRSSSMALIASDCGHAAL